MLSKSRRSEFVQGLVGVRVLTVERSIQIQVKIGFDRIYMINRILF